MWIDDQILTEAKRPYYGRYWQPQAPVVVLGRSNDAEVECLTAQCRADGVQVLKRAGGGGTVVLFPGCAIISCGMWVARSYHNDFYFRLINAAVIDVFANSHPSLKQLVQSGISDISIEGRKVAGTSMFRSRNYLLYQASILVDCDIEMIEKYLRHPSKEPEYRKGRSHRDFVVGLSSLLTAFSTEQAIALLASDFEDFLRRRLADELIQPPSEQVAYIEAKVAAENPL